MQIEKLQKNEIYIHNVAKRITRSDKLKILFQLYIIKAQKSEMQRKNIRGIGKFTTTI